MKEATLWRRIRENTPEVFWTRIESGSTVLGLPDAVGILEGVVAFVELKNYDKPSPWTPFQQRWAYECLHHGSRYFVVSGGKGGIEIFAPRCPSLWLENPVSWERFRDKLWG